MSVECVCSCYHKKYGHLWCPLDTSLSLLYCPVGLQLYMNKKEDLKAVGQDLLETISYLEKSLEQSQVVQTTKKGVHVVDAVATTAAKGVFWLKACAITLGLWVVTNIILIITWIAK